MGHTGKPKRSANTGAPASTSGESQLTRASAMMHSPHDTDPVRALVLRTGHFSWAAAPDGTLTDALLWSAYTGQDLADLQHDGWLRAVHAEDRDRTSALWIAALAEPRPLVHGYRLRRFDGEYRQIISHVSPVSDVEHRVTGWVGVITEAPAPEDARSDRLEHAQLRQLLDSAPDGVYLADADGRLVDVNVRGFSVLGYTSRDEIIGARIQDLFSPDEETISEEGRRAMLAGETVVRERRLRRKDGTAVPVEITAKVIPDGTWLAFVRDISGRTRLEEQLRLQASMLDRTHEAIFLWELGGSIVFWNRGAEQLYGYPASEAVGRVSHELLHTVFPLPSSRKFEAMLRREREWSGELIHTARDGRSIVVDSRHQVLHEPDGRLYVLETSHDITDRKRLEQELAARASQLEATFDTMLDGVLVYDDAGTIVEANRAARRMMGYDTRVGFFQRPDHQRAEAYSLAYADGQSVPSDEMPIRRLLRGELLTSERGQDYRVRTLDGRELLLNLTGAPIRRGDGSITGGVILARDVGTQRALEHRTQEALSALLTMASTLVEPGAGSDDGQPAPQHGNAIAQRLAELTCRVLGCKRVGIIAIEPETQLQRPVAVVGLTPEQERGWWAEQEANPTRYGEGADPRILARFAAGEALVLDMTAPPYDQLPNPYGITTSLVAPMRAGAEMVGILSLDYAGERHEFTVGELALAAAVAQLSALVIERERLLREREEARASELALLTVTERMDDFLSMAAHDLKSPAAGSKLNIQIASRRVKRLASEVERAPATTPLASIAPQLEEIEGSLRKADRSIERLARMVDRLLDVSRARTGKLDFQPASFDLAEIVREAVEEQQALAPGRAIQLHLPGAGGARVLVDADRIGQVVTNYLTNALRYAPPDEPVEVTFTTDGQQARVGVRDYGSGIPLEEQSSIWGRFEQVHSASRPRGAEAGLGLGLYISRSIIEQHGGQVGVESEPGHGAYFWFTLPLLAEDGLSA